MYFSDLMTNLHFNQSCSKILSLLICVFVFISITCKQEETGPPSNISFSTISSSFNESSGTHLTKLLIDPPAAKELKIYYEIVSFLATENLDFKINSTNPLVVPKGASVADLSFSIIDDSVPGETFCNILLLPENERPPETFEIRLIRS